MSLEKYLKEEYPVKLNEMKWIDAVANMKRDLAEFEWEEQIQAVCNIISRCARLARDKGDSKAAAKLNDIGVALDKLVND